MALIGGNPSWVEEGQIGVAPRGPVDRAPLASQISQLRTMIEEAHVHLNRLAGHEPPSQSDVEQARPDTSGAPLIMRINELQAMVADCQKATARLIQRIDRVSEEANSLA